MWETHTTRNKFPKRTANPNPRLILNHLKRKIMTGLLHSSSFSENSKTEITV